MYAKKKTFVIKWNLGIAMEHVDQDLVMAEIKKPKIIKINS